MTSKTPMSVVPRPTPHNVCLETYKKQVNSNVYAVESRLGSVLAVVIPFYKIAYFEDLLKALAVQTDNRFRVYVGDDKSPNPPVELIRKFADRLDITYVRFHEQMGRASLVRQWNRCLDLVGDEEWIWVLPDDDIPSENFVEEFYLALEAERGAHNPPSVYRAPICIIDADGNVIQEAAPGLTFEDNMQFYLSVLRGQTMCSLGDNVFSAHRLRERGGFVEFPKGWGSDHATVLNVARGQGIHTLASTRFYFRMSGLNISSNQNDGAQKLQARLEFAKWLKTSDGLFPQDPGQEFFKLFLHKGEHYVVHEWPFSFAVCIAYYQLSKFCYGSWSALPLLKVLASKMLARYAAYRETRAWRGSFR